MFILLLPSIAVTVKLKPFPAVTDDGADTLKYAPCDTAIAPEVPVIDEVTVSVAEIDWVPTVFRVAKKVPLPLGTLESEGRTAAPSLLVKWTVPG